MSVGICLNLPAGFAMDRQYQSGGGQHLYNSQESSSSSTLWDLDSSSLIVPEYLTPSAEYANRQQLGDTSMRREISEESGYQTAIDEGSSSWASDWPTDDYNHHWSKTEAQHQENQIDDAMCWLQQQQPTTWAFPDDTPIQPTSSYEATSSYTVTGRSESTSSDDSNQVSVPSGKSNVYTKYQITDLLQKARWYRRANRMLANASVDTRNKRKTKTCLFEFYRIWGCCEKQLFSLELGDFRLTFTIISWCFPKNSCVV